MAPIRPDLPSGTVTFLFTDVEGSTRLLRQLGAEQYAKALAEHRRVIREACARHEGVEVDTQGDAFFYAFQTAPGALGAATAITDGLGAGPIRVRMGLHTGTPLATEAGYVGPDVHRAARIAASGHGGQVLISSSTAALLEEYQLRDLGEHRFKDLAAPQRVYQLRHLDFPALKSLYHTNLPVPSTPFLGRERELSEVIDLLTRDDVRVLTLTGPGGTGKTRLALQAAAEASDDFPDGIFWVSLAAIRQPSLVLPQIAQALEGVEDVAVEIGDRRLLLLLDNFEHVVEAGVDVAELLSNCANLNALVTSRESLRLSGEREYPVAPFVSEDATGFFLARAQTVDPSIASSAAVAEICSRLDNLPLALELAAARIKVLSAEKILERLEKRLPLLTGGARDAPERQQTLNATIEWSYDLLAAEEQRLFRHLSVLAGGCALETAEEVARADLDTLHSLVAKSLVRRTAERYWMLETIREFALGRLEESGEAESVRRSHAEHFAAVAETANREFMYGSAVRAPLQKLRAEQENFRAAVEWAANATETELQLRLVHAVRTFWEASGFGRECQTWLETALARADDLPTIVRARALANLGWFANRYGDPKAGIDYHERSLDLYRSVGDEEGIARSLVGVARGLEELGQMEEAREQLEEALRTARNAQSLPVVLGALTGLTFIALLQRDFDRASELSADLSELDTADQPLALFVNGLIALERGDSSRAVSCFGESVRDLHGIGLKGWLPGPLDALAAGLAARGDLEEAAVLVGQSNTLRRSLGTQPDTYVLSLQERVIERGTQELGEEAIRAAMARGARMTLDDAVEYALVEAATDA